MRKHYKPHPPFLKMRLGSICASVCRRSRSGGSVLAMAGNQKCRNSDYQGQVSRFPVPDDKVPWGVSWPGYKPVDYTSPRVLEGPVWADPDYRKQGVTPPLYNQLDGKTDRRSHEGRYEVVSGVPRNPIGRTGMTGRGLLGKWGPNHAADPVVTRWRKNSSGKTEMADGKPCLEFVAIKRRDTGEWALPGGMVEAGDTVSITLKKEFGEEAMNSMEATEEEKKEIETHIDTLFHNGEEIYSGYVDDPRNTDNGWMETVAHNFHDETGDAVSRVQLQAGDDAGDVAWIQASSQLSLYASHTDFIKEVVKRKKAAW